MKTLQEYITDHPSNESLRELFAHGTEFRYNDPSHRRLYNSFVSWFAQAKRDYDEDLILNMLISAEEEIRLGEL